MAATLPLPASVLEDTEPVFDKPWQAQAFALTMQLSRRGAFTWGEWVEVFSTEIRTHPALPDEDSTTTYYRQWMTALETILVSRALSTSAEIAGMQDVWRAAYINTPHGQPIELRNADQACAAEHGQHDHHDDADHDHAHGHALQGRREPVAVSPGTSTLRRAVG